MMMRIWVPAGVRHLRLVPVVGEETVLQDKPALLVALDVVGPLVQPSLHIKRDKLGNGTVRYIGNKKGN